MKTSKSLAASTLAAASLAFIALTTSSTVFAEEIGDAQILAQVPLPGFPEGIVTNGLLTYVTGPATFGTAGNGTPSKTWVYYTPTGQLVNTIDVEGENLDLEHANSCAADDALGRLYINNTQLGVIRLSLFGQETYGAPLPDLLPCSEVPSGTACSPLPVNTPPLANDLAFDKAGNLYVTDSLQATIWKYKAGGGAPEIWFQDLRLAPGATPGDIGVNGIRVSPNGQQVFVSVTLDFNEQSHIYSLPLVKKPTAADLTLFHTFGPGDLADGIAFGKSGLLYVADATPFSSGVIALDPRGSEVLRLENPVNSPIAPYDSPANISFDGKGSMLLTNHAFVTGVNAPEQFAVVKVFVNDKAGKLFKPLLLP